MFRDRCKGNSLDERRRFNKLRRRDSFVGRVLNLLTLVHSNDDAVSNANLFGNLDNRLTDLDLLY